MRNSKGFTLVELMIVVGIVSILASVSFAFYGDFVLKSNRTEARAALSDMAGRLEKCRSLYGSYNSASCNVDTTITTESGRYTTSGVPAATSFTITATAAGPQAKDTDCATLSLSNTGLRTATGGDTANCW